MTTHNHMPTTTTQEMASTTPTTPTKNVQNIINNAGDTRKQRPPLKNEKHRTGSHAQVPSEDLPGHVEAPQRLPGEQGTTSRHAHPQHPGAVRDGGAVSSALRAGKPRRTRRDLPYESILRFNITDRFY